MQMTGVMNQPVLSPQARAGNQVLVFYTLLKFYIYSKLILLLTVIFNQARGRLLSVP